MKNDQLMMKWKWLIDKPVVQTPQKKKKMENEELRRINLQ